MRTLILACMLAAAPAAAQSCPDADPEAGYPITATVDEPAADSAWLTSVARAAAYRWRVPSRRRGAYAGWERVERRILPPEPRWADDWTPGGAHRAILRLVLYRDGRRPRRELVSASGDGRFDGSLASIVDDPMPGAPPLPELPAGWNADSLVVLLTFGEEPETAVRGRVRFAAAQTPVELHRNTLRVLPPRGFSRSFPRTTVKYDVREDGRVDVRSIEFLRPVPHAVERAIRDGLRGARFSPATSNCRPVAQTVVQTFGG